MVQRGWDFKTLMAMTVSDFKFWLETAIDAAKDEQAAQEKAAKS